MNFKPFWELLDQLGIQLPDPSRISEKKGFRQELRPSTQSSNRRMIRLPAEAADLSPQEMMQRLAELIETARLDEEQHFSSADFWVPPGKTVTVSGYKIPGMVYFGEGLMAVNHRGIPEPSLIRAGLKVDRKNSDPQGLRANYYDRSYTQMKPGNRAAYLEWLSEGRSDPKAYSGYVWLFFWGLERRALHELLKTDLKTAAQQQEFDQIIAEVERLNKIYGAVPSMYDAFRQKAEAFLSICRLLRSPNAAADLKPMEAKPLELQVALGQKIAQRQPIPADWALAWYVKLSGYQLPLAATRCMDEFVALFRLRYGEKFGEGLKLKAGKSTLRATYYPASQSFWGRPIDVKLGDLPDVSKFTAKLNQIGELIKSCRLELEPLSRLIGRNPHARNTAAAAALLPSELIATHGGAVVQKLQKWLDRLFAQPDTQIVLISGKDLLKHWAGNNPEKLTKNEATGLADFLERLGYGIEPDPRIGSLPTLKSHAVLFRTDPYNPTLLPADYFYATLAGQMALAVASGDAMPSPIERDYIATQLNSIVALPELVQLRLQAHLHWLLREKPTMRSIKARIEQISSARRLEIANFLIRAAAADGQVNPAEVKLLEKAYMQLELDPQTLYSDIHDLNTLVIKPASKTTAANEPVTVREAVSVQGHKIPAQPKHTSKKAVDLDMDLVQTKLAESQEISSLLADIFVEDQPAKVAQKTRRPAKSKSQPKSQPKSAVSRTVAGLDPAHSELLLALAQKPHWQRSELEPLAVRLNLLLDGALEVINEAAFDRCDEAVIEGDDPLEINSEVLQSLLA